MRTPLLAVLLGLTSLAACRDEDPVVAPAVAPGPEPLGYVPKTSGSYWVYEIQSSETGGQTPQSYIRYDSVVVAGDSLVRGARYAVFRTYPGRPYTWYHTVELLRDSAQYVVNAAGLRVFSATDFTSPLSFQLGGLDTVRVTQMAHRDSVIQVPAITAPTYDARLCHRGYYYCRPLYGPYEHRFYAAGIGLIKQTMVYCGSAPNISERRLIRYHVAQPPR